MWCRDASSGCDFRADVAVWDDIGSLHDVWRLRGLELEPDMILVWGVVDAALDGGYQMQH